MDGLASGLTTSEATLSSLSPTIGVGDLVWVIIEGAQELHVTELKPKQNEAILSILFHRFCTLSAVNALRITHTHARTHAHKILHPYSIRVSVTE